MLYPSIQRTSPLECSTKLNTSSFPLILCLLCLSYLKEGIVIHPVDKARKWGVIFDSTLSPPSTVHPVNVHIALHLVDYKFHVLRDYFGTENVSV